MSNSKDESCNKIHRFGHLVANPFYADLKFVMIDDNNIEIPAHKLIVSTISDEMRKMIYGMFNNDFTKSHLEVRETSATTFTEVLRFIYTEKTNITEDNAVEMLNVSNYYAIENLEKQCINFLLDRINSINACTMYAYFSQNYDYGKLAETCKKVIQKTTKTAFDSEGFYQMDANQITELLKIDVLNISELNLYKALLNWAENECKKRNLDTNATNKRNVLCGAEKFIRLRTVTLDQFEDCIRLEPQFFNETEIEEIENCIINKNLSNETKRKFYVCQGLKFAISF